MGLGWDELGDLSPFSSQSKIQKKMIEVYNYTNKPTNNSKATWQFAHEISPGDIIFVKQGMHHVIGRGVVQSDYMFIAERNEYKHTRKVDWTHSGRWPFEGLPRKTLTEISDQKKQQRLESVIEQAPSIFQEKSRRICIICWNTNMWKYPSILAGKHGGFVGKNKFGHEEWLNRTEWLLNGYDGTRNNYHYAHLQGVYTKANKYNGERFDILLCSRSPNSQYLAIGRIHEAFVIDEEEAKWASRRIIDKDWLETMRGEVIAAGGDPAALPPETWDGESGEGYDQFQLANIKYRPNTIEFFQEFIPYDPPALYNGRAYEWDGSLPNNKVMDTSAIFVPQSGVEGRFQRYSEAVHYRRASTGKEVTPRQSPIQWLLAEELDKRLKINSRGIVSSELNRVDLTISLFSNNIEKRIFIEIKCTDSVRRSIRLALGQLLEYAHFPGEVRADKLVIITDQQIDSPEIDYTKWIRNHYGINIYLMQFDPEKGWTDDQYEELLALK